MMLSVPVELSDVNSDWVLALVCHINQLRSEPQILGLEIHPEPNCEGVLSDICKVFIHVKTAENHNFVYNLFVKIIPRRFKSIVTSHRLFNKEIAFYR